MKSLRFAASAVLAVAFGLGALSVSPPALGGEKLPPELREYVRSMVDDMRQRGWVGVEMRRDEADGSLTIVRVLERSPAERAGFRVGDVMIARNGLEFGKENRERIQREHAAAGPGDRVRYTVLRNGRQVELEVELGEIPARVLMHWVGMQMIRASGIDLDD
jgi:S1-C subfamily serine protease